MKTDNPRKEDRSSRGYAPTSRLIKIALYDYARLLEEKSSIIESKLSYNDRFIEVLRQEIERLRKEKQELEEKITRLKEELNICREELREKPRRIRTGIVRVTDHIEGPSTVTIF